MILLACRHGNTFESSETPLWVGARNDLPLTARGEEQAKDLASALQRAGVSPAAVFCGPLQRAREFARIVMGSLGANGLPLVDSRLDELDYGEWSGLSDAEVRTRFGDAAVNAWEKQAQWPRGCGWVGSPETVTDQLRSFISDCTAKFGEDEFVLAVSSNGKLRYLSTFFENQFERRLAEGSLKVRTGNVCVLRIGHKESAILGWNLTPAEFAAGPFRGKLSHP